MREKEILWVDIPFNKLNIPYGGSTYTYLTAYDLASMVGVGNNGAGIDKSREILTSVFQINTTYVSGQMSAGNIVNNLQSNRLMLAGFANTNSGHMVVLCGYDDGGNGASMMYYVRDSNYSSSYKIVAPLGSSAIAMDYYSSAGIMFWNETAYKN